MQRVKRFRRSDFASTIVNLVEPLNGLIKSLPVSDKAKSLFALPEQDGEYINFYSLQSGDIVEVPTLNGEVLFSAEQVLAKNNFADQRQELLNTPIPNVDTVDNSNLTVASFLKLLVEAPQYVMVLDNRDVVIVPYFSEQYLQNLLATKQQINPTNASANDAGAVMASSGSRWLWLLLPLLLLLLGLAYYFFVYPWPFNKEAEPTVDPKTQLEQEIAEHEALLKELDRLIDQAKLRKELADQIQNNSRLNDQIVQADEKNKALQEQQLKDEEARKQLELQLEQLKKAQEQVKANKEEPKVVNVDNKPKALPKCSYIKKEGKIPALILASDGSGSMSIQLDKNQTRIGAAIKAAHSLVDQVDPNVPIKLIGIEGCPFAKDYGFFAGNQRSALKSAINKTNPLLKKRPEYILTPLVSALLTMASSAPADTDSVGILISDGVDTCEGTEFMNLCDIAYGIHQQKPKLKINVVLIGEDAPNSDCIAKITGGKVYRPNNTNKMIEDLKKAGSSLQKVCTE